VGTEPQQVTLGAADQAAAVCGVGDGCAAVAVAVRTLGTGLGTGSQREVSIFSHLSEGWTSLQPQVTWGRRVTVTVRTWREQLTPVIPAAGEAEPGGSEFEAGLQVGGECGGPSPTL
jgi:hypothetical protein